MLVAYAVVSGVDAVAAGVLAGWVLRHFLNDPVATVLQWVIGIGVVVSFGWYADVLDSWCNRRRSP